MADDSKDRNASLPNQPADVPLPGATSGNELQGKLVEQIAEFEAKMQQACKPALPVSPGGNKLGARKCATFKAICTAPSINRTPRGSKYVPLPYQTVQDLSNSVTTARTVNFNGLPAYLLDQTIQPKGTGDERGTGKGIRSKTVTGEVKPVSGCKTVRIEGRRVVREGDKCTMNGGNNPGVFVYSGVQPNPREPTIVQPACQNISSPNTFNFLRNPEPLFDSKKLFRTPPLRTYQPYDHRLEAWTERSDKQRQRTVNSLGIALLGIHGVFGTLARITGQDEDAVARANMVGASTLSLEAVAAPMLSMAPRTAVSRILPHNRGAYTTPTVPRAKGVRVEGRANNGGRLLSSDKLDNGGKRKPGPGSWPVTGGSGPVRGTIGITSDTSTLALQRYYPKGGGIEFVYDPITNVFVTGRTPKGMYNGSWHQQLAKAINASHDKVVGGTFSRGPHGEFITTEQSGHYGRNWNDPVRAQFEEWLNARVGKPVRHKKWGNE
ncbi:PAAR-like domain-containing protein [Pseudoduganella albidiflava]|uniref:DUF4150 domain-containing protein n=1 Tax=Pseudoduganella albidiflava TaxID=321983 RepID=A0A411WWU3_9BURK|nr:PAAR-like domain-containing protein [Pseudoduganella albidiflava]QBI01129.1 DUF4150 domain-containing protein [Pseudoduganella albidiflava]GGY48357.1 hypothetical protein GCM10007387_33160 [Pseudoduganella albidiflava]